MWRFVVRLFAIVGALAVLFLIVVGAGLWFIAAGGRPEPLADRIALHVELDRQLPEHANPDPVSRVFEDAPATLHETIEAIDRAAADERVVALVGSFAGDAFDLANAQELRAAVARFRAAGKPAIAYADSFGEFGPGNVAYYLASAFDEVWMQPIGAVGLTGIRAEIPFAQEALETWGVEAEFVRRGVYKSFPESLTERDFTEPHREMIASLTGDLYEQLVAGIAEGRGLSPGDTRRLIDNGPFLAQEALEAGLLDGFVHRRDLEGLVAQRIGTGDAGEAAEPETPETVAPRDYLDALGEADADGARVAVIYAAGTIVTGDSSSDPLLGSVVMGADTIADAIDEALDDDETRAIVLRIDSGGGSAVASEVIGRAVRRAEEAGTPLIVSMGNAAASGGYWIAAHAAEIVAQPATLTGSIGVFAGKIVTEQFWEDLGVNWEGVQHGRHAGIWSSGARYSPEEAERVDAIIEDLYGRFVALVAEGRGMEPAAVDAIAQGRVWTGAQALELGLVDRLGGLDTALVAVREALSLPADAPLDLVTLPEQPGLFEAMFNLASGAAAPAAGIAARLPALAPYLARLEPLLADPATAALRMPPIVFRDRRAAP